MKTTIRIPFAGNLRWLTAMMALGSCVLGLRLFAQQIEITSFDVNGKLTWTNAISNATYRVEWASTVTGPWNNFQFLTSLDSVVATGTVASVKVPMFYRVAAGPTTQSPVGVYRYKGYNAEGNLLVVGYFSIVPRGNPPSTNQFDGTWAFGYAGQEPSPGAAGLFHQIGRQIGEGDLAAFLSTDSKLIVQLNPQIPNENLAISGNLNGDTFTGIWGWYFFTPLTNGTFVAERIAACPR